VNRVFGATGDAVLFAAAVVWPWERCNSVLKLEALRPASLDAETTARTQLLDHCRYPLGFQKSLLIWPTAAMASVRAVYAEPIGKETP